MQTNNFNTLKLWLSILIICVSMVSASAQEFEVPSDYTFDSTTNYAAYDSSIIACFHWLMNEPCNVDLVKRKSARKFLNDWIEATPTVTVTISQDVLPYLESSPDLVLYFMGGWVVHALNASDYDEVSASLAGTEAVLTFYTKNKSFLRQDDHIDRLLVLKKRGKLEKRIRRSVK